MTDRCPLCGQAARMDFVRAYYEYSTYLRPIMNKAVEIQDPNVWRVLSF